MATLHDQIDGRALNRGVKPYDSPSPGGLFASARFRQAQVQQAALLSFHINDGYYRQPSLGFLPRGGAAALNVGIRHGQESGAEHLWFLNDDVIVAPDALEEALRAWADVPRCDAYVAIAGLALFTAGLALATGEMWLLWPMSPV